ncbi:hypothetical protein CHS0354_029927 [Potamilus streckersoni]|uniref:Origin recognition complex subunit 5 n=1 Tax=Potamilus streckersoni TaxID=2493646 RepID=A0AAE0RSY2_9BIVA|nr:hypothetical protein CHS0354_029927 [Potamilus streckersoni]
MTSASSEDPGTIINEIIEEIPCRQKQISTLMALFGKRVHFTPAALFLYGHTATGKSLVVSTLMDKLKLPFVLLNCVECYSQRFLYEHILNSLYQTDLFAFDESVPRIKCDNMNDFMRLFKQVLNEKRLDKETVYIIMDKAERLRDMEANILPAFLRLQELSSSNVCVILLSEIVWEKFRWGTGFAEPFILHFPDYKKDELLQILSKGCPANFPESCYAMYLNLVLSVFHHVCRDLREIQHLVNLNFMKFTEPIRCGEATSDDSKKLWKNIEPHLKKALQTVYLREVSSSQWERYQAEIARDMEQENTSQSLQGLSHRCHVELPYYSKYLLIAAYLASYNPAKTDKRFFAKHSEKKSKKTLQKKKHERASNHMLGPKPFPLDRLMAIFYSIVEGKVAPTANIFMQITSLVSLHMLAQVAGDDQIETPKYKCLISLDFIKSVARTVNFDVVKYLYDFV